MKASKANQAAQMPSTSTGCLAHKSSEVIHYQPGDVADLIHDQRTEAESVRLDRGWLE
jgi:hypothetical protein